MYEETGLPGCEWILLLRIRSWPVWSLHFACDRAPMRRVDQAAAVFGKGLCCTQMRAMRCWPCAVDMEKACAFTKPRFCGQCCSCLDSCLRAVRSRHRRAPGAVARRHEFIFLATNHVCDEMRSEDAGLADMHPEFCRHIAGNGFVARVVLVIHGD